MTTTVYISSPTTNYRIVSLHYVMAFRREREKTINENISGGVAFVRSEYVSTSSDKLKAMQNVHEFYKTKCWNFTGKVTFRQTKELQLWVVPCLAKLNGFL